MEIVGAPSGAPRSRPVIVGEQPSSPPARVMPPDFSISLHPSDHAERVVAERGERRQPMRGVEDEYVDIVDYIVRITHRIWEDQDVGYIYDTYSSGCAVYDDGGMKYGVERVVEETMQSINAFPDARHYADEIIWAGDEDQGFATSHRAINVGHHTGPWRFGPPTGRKINTWVIANCVMRENEIFEEWVLYNTGAKLAQLGIDIPSAARAFGNEGGLAALGEYAPTEIERLVGGRKPDRYPAAAGAGFDVEHVFDIPLASIVREVLKAKPAALLLEASNPRHAHEWAVWQEVELPDDKVLVPGVIDTTTNFVEHPELVAERICRFAELVGRERVIAGTDCGFGTFAGFGAIEPSICWRKLASLVEGAALASTRLW